MGVTRGYRQGEEAQRIRSGSKRLVEQRNRINKAYCNINDGWFQMKVLVDDMQPKSTWIEINMQFLQARTCMQDHATNTVWWNRALIVDDIKIMHEMSYLKIFTHRVGFK